MMASAVSVRPSHPGCIHPLYCKGTSTSIGTKLGLTAPALSLPYILYRWLPETAVVSTQYGNSASSRRQGSLAYLRWGRHSGADALRFRRQM
jgi:hypothetical protein